LNAVEAGRREVRRDREPQAAARPAH
jgi:hypothetical protein